MFIKLGDKYYSQAAIRSMRERQNGDWWVEFIDGHERKVDVLDAPTFSTIYSAPPGFELWTLDLNTLSEYVRYTVVAFRHVTDIDGVPLGRPQPILASEDMSDLSLDCCILVDTVTGTAIGFDPDEVATSDIDDLKRWVAEEAQKRRKAAGVHRKTA